MVWTGGWAVAGWKLGGGIGGFVGWVMLPVVAVLLGHTAPVVLACFGLAVLMLARRMQGNPGREESVRAAFHRAIFDRDPGTVDEVAGIEETAS